ncbi:MAG: RCC1 repeat-containing protein, partial [Polyangia bacterium]
PVPVVGLDHGYVAVSAGSSHTCALSEEGEAKCWGRNETGALGDGTTQGSLEPVEVAGLNAGIASVDSGAGFTCAVTEGGGAKCWGMGGRCGVDSYDNKLVPTDVVGLATGVTRLAVSSGHGCAMVEDGSARCWGHNGDGELGNGTTEYALTPTEVTGLDTALTDIAPGYDHTCAAYENGQVACWGSNSYGQLGLGAVGGIEYEPVEVSGLDSVEITSVASGGYHTCALTSAGGIKCWGEYENGQLGNGMGADVNEECVESDDCLMPTPVDVVGFGQ